MLFRFYLPLFQPLTCVALSNIASSETRPNSRSVCKKKLTQKNPTFLQKLKELAAEAEDDEEIVSDLIPQSDSDNI